MKILLTLFVLFFSSAAFGWQKCTQGNCENGYGTYVNKPLIGGSSKYVGNWKNGKEHGKGTYTWSSGAKYIGEWINGEMSGQGTYIWSSGNKYVGEWKNGKQSGLGTVTYSDGRIEHGIWDGWTLIQSKQTKEEIQQEQQAIIQEQEVKAQKEIDSRQKKMDTCKAYGFEAGTEAFGNCIFKLMELELEYAKLENEKLKLEAQAEQAKLNNQAALANSLATQAQAANQDKALRIQQFGLAMQGLANTLQPTQPTTPRITCNKIGNITHCY